MQSRKKKERGSVTPGVETCSSGRSSVGDAGEEERVVRWW